MAYDNNNFGSQNNNERDNRNESIYSKRVKAGKRRTYFFDVRATRGNDYFITITESKKRNDDNGYERHKMFIYKEDFNKFLDALTDTVDYVKTDLMPDFDFDAFSHDDDDYQQQNPNSFANAPAMDSDAIPVIQDNLQPDQNMLQESNSTYITEVENVNNQKESTTITTNEEPLQNDTEVEVDGWKM